MAGTLRIHSYTGLATAPGDWTHTHEPEGMSLVSDASWDDETMPTYPSLNADGWGLEIGGANYSRITPGDNPASAPYAARAFFSGPPNPHPGGGAPVTINLDITPCDELYMHMAIRWSAAWDDNGNAGTKVAFVVGQHDANYANWFINATPLFGIQLESPDSSIGVQNWAQYGFSNSLDWYSGSALDDGEWQDWEIHAKSNTGTSYNGTLKFWRNGTLVLDLADVKWFVDGAPKRWFTMQWSPTYGGGENDSPKDQWQDLDHWYISSKVNGF